jgi:hypothetical protein
MKDMDRAEQTIGARVWVIRDNREIDLTVQPAERWHRAFGQWSDRQTNSFVKRLGLKARLTWWLWRKSPQAWELRRSPTGQLELISMGTKEPGFPTGIEAPPGRP